MKYLQILMILALVTAWSLPVDAAKKKKRWTKKKRPVRSAQTAQPADGPPAETHYSFEDDLVTGDLVRPDGEQLIVRKRGRRGSLIRIREHFIPEMLKSVEDL